jgi:uncharacterized protein YcnI
MSRSKLLLALFTASTVYTQYVHAHASFVINSTSVPYAAKGYFATLNLGHGCEDSTGKLYDSSIIEVTIPAAFTGVRPMPSTFGKASVVKDGAGNVTKLIWTKANSDKLPEDTQLYQVSFKGTLPATPFSTLGFETVQTCENGLSIEWKGTDTPTLYIVPARTVGWNKYTTPSSVLDLTGTGAKFFTDAAIVWKGKEGYSVNPNTLQLIQKNATELKQIPAGSDIWVKY